MKHTISTEKSKLDIEMIHDYLCNQSYWAKGRSLESVQKSIDNSMCFGLYDDDGNQLGFARVLTDKVIFAYLMDFFIVEKFQGKGLGTLLAQHIYQHPDLQVRLNFLATDSATGLYEKVGFTRMTDLNKYMFKRDENIC